MFGSKTHRAGNVTIIPNAIDIDRFKFNMNLRQKTRKELGLEDKFIIGNVGRCVSQKNQSFLIDIFFEIQKTNKDCNLIIIGDGPLTGILIDKVKKLKIEEKVIFAGVHKNIENFYNAMDYFVFPSLYEGLGMCLVEAQISGLKCITSSNVPLEAKISNGVQFVSLKNNRKFWAKLINNDIGNKVDRSKIEFLDIEKYDIKIASTKIVDIYINIVNEEKKR